MSSSQKRLELKVDVFEKASQRAMPLPTLKPPELVEAILQEFRELEYLSDTAADYQLLKADDASLLNDEEPIRNQLAKGSHIVIAENEESMPQGTSRPSNPIYLREQASGKVG